MGFRVLLAHTHSVFDFFHNLVMKKVEVGGSGIIGTNLTLHIEPQKIKYNDVRSLDLDNQL